MIEKPWNLERTQVISLSDVNENRGLTDAQAKDRYEKYGPNTLAEDELRSFLQMILEQFDDPLVKILLLAALISTLLALNDVLTDAGHSLFKVAGFNDINDAISMIILSATLERYIEPIVILCILFLNAAVGVWQESNAEKSLQSLKKMQPSIASVLRNSIWNHSFPSSQLVPGDIVKLTVGQIVPADCRLIRLKTTTLRTEEMTLTGESATVIKDTLSLSHDIEIQGRKNMLFSGTSVANGTGIAIVTATGVLTELGKIQKQIKEAEHIKSEEKTPLKQKLSEFSDQLQYLIGFVCLLVWLINYHYFIDFNSMTVDFKACVYYFQIAVALAVAAIPEGLPTVITMCLALGTRKMSKKNSIVRRLPAVETLGCTSVICSDKTGTLTTNQMSVNQVIIFEKSHSIIKQSIFEVTGTSYDPTNGAFEASKFFSDEKCLQQLVKIASLCNDSEIVYKDSKSSAGKYEHVGMPTEAALRVLVEKMLKDTLHAKSEPSNPTPGNDKIRSEYDKVAILEFTRDRKSMSIISNGGYGAQNELLVKGAPENLLARSEYILLRDGSIEKMTNEAREKVQQSVKLMAGQAWRCLGFAFKQDLTSIGLHDYKKGVSNPFLTDPLNFVEVETNLIFVGLVSLRDPPRPEVKQAISDCGAAGISVVVITGDNKLTAEAICKDIGVLEEYESTENVSFLGSEFALLPKEQQIQKLYRNGKVKNFVFSRCEPKFKQDIVKLLKEQGEVVAMTGDGVNDAPALKLADIGVAMGLTGTEVAKTASDMVLTDDNFSTIVSAIEEGRSIFNNMKAFIRYMISSNIGEVASIFFTAAIGLPECLIPVQLLWVNLVTDGPPATALGFNPSDPGIMKQPPRNKNDDLISRWLMFRYIVVGLYVGLATVGIFIVWYTCNSFLGLDISQDNHPTVSLQQLMSFEKCELESMSHVKGYKIFGFEESYLEVKGCDFFGVGKQKPSTLSLSVLVTIEMFNSLNALSENESLFVVTPLVNPYLLLAMLSSFVSHFLILYTPGLSGIFEVVPLSVNEWLLVIMFAFPVIVIDEVLKFFGRTSLKINLMNQKKNQ